MLKYSRYTPLSHSHAKKENLTVIRGKGSSMSHTNRTFQPPLCERMSDDLPALLSLSAESWSAVKFRAYIIFFFSLSHKKRSRLFSFLLFTLPLLINIFLRSTGTARRRCRREDVRVIPRMMEIHIFLAVCPCDERLSPSNKSNRVEWENPK